MMINIRRAALGALVLVALASCASAQTLVRLWPNGATGSMTDSAQTVTVTNARGMATVGIQVTGTFDGTLTPGCSVNTLIGGSTFVAIPVAPADDPSTTATTITAAGLYIGSVAGCDQVRVISSLWMSGTAVVTINTVQVGGGGGSAGGAAGDVTISQGGNDAVVTAGGELTVTCGDCSGTGVSAVDDAAFAVAMDSLSPIGGLFDDVATDSVNEGDTGILRMSGNRVLYNIIRDAAGNERGALVTANNELLVEIGAGSAAIGSVSVSNASGASAVNIQDGGNTISVDNGGTFAVQAAQSGTWNITDISGTVSLPTGASTLAEQQTQSTSLATIAGDTTDIEAAIEGLDHAEDAAHASGQFGIMALAVRQDTQSDFAADGDYVPLSINADGELRVAFAGAAGGTSAADDADFTAGSSDFTPSGGFYQSSVTACTDGDICAFGITAQRTLKVTLFSAAGAELTPSQDWTVGSAIGTTGPGMMLVYSDFDGAALPTVTNVNTEGEAVPAAASIKGVQYVMLVSEDGALERGTATTPIIAQPAAGSGSGASPLKYTSVGSTEDEHAVCTGACNIYSITVTNTNAAARYLRCENDTAGNTTPGSETVELDLAIPGATTGAGFSATFPVGAAFSTAATCWLVTGAADSNTDEVAADEIKVFYTFKQ